ncbi:MAG: hypothetical protein HS113_03310 [Verrucomicrobiales bacterium]|nr:hypothetical protein [Verrucomicrobiales bacterium]
MVTNRAREGGGQNGSPPWVLIMGAVFGGLTLLFFMALVVVTMTGANGDLGRGTRQLIAVVMAFATALSFSFIGGSAAANGHLSLPFVKSHPVAFGVSGGIGVFVIVLLLGLTVFVGRPDDPRKSSRHETRRPGLTRSAVLQPAIVGGSVACATPTAGRSASA